MRLFNKVAIIGTGLIGGSLALAIKKNNLARQVVGVSRHKSTLSRAKKIGAIEAGSQEIDIINGADLVVLALPVNAILNLTGRIAKFIKPGCIVSDVGSTKEAIVARLERIFPLYVGAHPLTGSEKRGIGSARKDIFKGCLCVLTPTKNTDPRALRKIKKLWEKVGSKVVSLTPAEHDKALSFASHLPHLAAFSLIDTVPGKYLKFAAGGLKDTTRIALSESGLWADIFLTNPENIAVAIDSFRAKLDALKSALGKKDKKKLIKILKAAKQKRELL